MKRFVLAAVCLAACVTTEGENTRPAVTSPEPIHLTLVGTNDVHGWVMPQVEHFATGDIRMGGVATFSAYLKILREENPGGVILVDAGDMFQGTLMSNLTEGSVVIDTFNALGYDAAAIGNHEFDYGPVGPISAATQPNLDPFGALKARITQSKFPLLSTNIYETATGLRPRWLPGDGTTIIERKGVKIGIVGLTTPQTPTTTLPVNVSTLKFAQLGPEAQLSAKRLRQRGADVVIAVVHAGAKCADVHNQHDTSTCDVDVGEIFGMLKGLPEGTIDAVVAGHTHMQLNHFVNGTPVMQSLALGRYFGTMDLTIDPIAKHVIQERTQINAAIPICETVDEATNSCDFRSAGLKPVSGDGVITRAATFHGHRIVPDPSLNEVMAPVEQTVGQLQRRDLGLNVPEKLGRNFEDDSALGAWLADSLRDMENADIALLNPGGLRADLNKGPLTYGAVYEVIPFDNWVSTLNLDGDELLRLLNASFSGKKGVFQVSGIEVKLGRCPNMNRLKGATLTGGKPIEAAKHYKVVMPDFLGRGGDGLAAVLATVDPSRVDIGENRPNNLRDDLVAFWQAKRSNFVAVKKPRVTFVDEGKECIEIEKDQQKHIP